MNFSEIVKNKLIEENLKISDLAKKTGYSIQYMSDLIAGKRRWNETTITKASNILGIKIKFINSTQSNDNEETFNIEPVKKDQVECGCGISE